jgi:RNA polymerase sigma-70 factor (ECF subfamily)
MGVFAVEFNSRRVVFFRKSSPAFNERDVTSVLAACRGGDTHAQRALFNLFYSYGKSICLRHAANAEDAEEILNDGFMKVFQHLPTYDPALPFKAWFRSILIRTCIDYHRRRGKYNYHLDLEVVEAPALDGSVVDQIAAEEILSLVQQLPTSYRTVFVLHVMDGYNHREIGELLGINEVTSRTNFMKARLKLQERVSALYPHLLPAGLTGKYREN